MRNSWFSRQTRCLCQLMKLVVVGLLLRNWSAKLALKSPTSFARWRKQIRLENDESRTRCHGYSFPTILVIDSLTFQPRFDINFIFQQHYVVREVQVEAYCHCNGHADGINCPYNVTIKDRVCVCQEGTCGVQCGYCCQAYNQYPFKSGSRGPFATDKDAACESKLL